MRRERNDFIKELVSGKITIPKEVDVKETGWKIMINRITDGGSVAHMNAVYGFLRDRKRVRSERRGKRTDRKRICRNKPRKANADPLDPDGRAVRSN